MSKESIGKAIAELEEYVPIREAQLAARKSGNFSLANKLGDNAIAIAIKRGYENG